DMNPLPDGKGGQEYLRPLNMVPAGTVYTPPMSTIAPDPEDQPAPGQDEPADTPPPDAPNDEGHDDPDSAARNASPGLLRAFASEAARRVVRKEVTALRKSLARSGKQFDAAAFAAEARTF